MGRSPHNLIKIVRLRSGTLSFWLHIAFIQLKLYIDSNGDRPLPLIVSEAVRYTQISPEPFKGLWKNQAQNPRISESQGHR
jgi:hypothetical protein